MKLKLAALAIAALATAAVSIPAAEAKSRKDAQTWPIADILNHKDYATKIGDFKFSFGDKVSGKDLGETHATRPTSGFGKSDHDACVWAALGVLIALKADAVNHGGTSVQGLKSTIGEGEAFSSATEFQCISGNTNSRVAFSGKIVK